MVLQEEIQYWKLAELRSERQADQSPPLMTSSHFWANVLSPELCWPHLHTKMCWLHPETKRHLDLIPWAESFLCPRQCDHVSRVRKVRVVKTAQEAEARYQQRILLVELSTNSLACRKDISLNWGGSWQLSQRWVPEDKWYLASRKGG